MTALVLNPYFHSFRVETPALGKTRLKLFNSEETKSFSLDEERFVSRNFDPIKIELQKIFFECRQENWDGYGAKPILKDVLIEALYFINMMPQNFPTPEIVPEPTGEIGFEWGFGKDRIFVATVKGTGVVAYAGLLGSDELRTRGTDILDDAIFQSFEKILNRINPAIS